MLLNSCTYGQDVHIKYYLIWFESHLLCKKCECPATYFNFSFKRYSLPLLIKCHNYNVCSKRLYLGCLAEELFLTLFKADRIHYTPTAAVVQSGKDCLPIGRIYHKRNFCNIRIIGDISQECLHLLRTVEHCIVHIYIYNGCPHFYLFAGNVSRLGIILLPYKSCKFCTTGHIGPLSHIYKVALLPVYPKPLKAAKVHIIDI